jgi:hypothetical protein
VRPDEAIAEFREGVQRWAELHGEPRDGTLAAVGRDVLRWLDHLEAEAARPRPRLRWYRYSDGTIVAEHEALVGDLTPPASSLVWLAHKWADLVAAGFDVDPLPKEVPDADR